VYGQYYDSVNGSYNNLYTTSIGNQNTGNIFSVLANIGGSVQFFSNGPSQTFYMFARTFNNDGYYVDSGVVGYSTVAQQSYYTYQSYSPTTSTYSITTNTANNQAYGGLTADQSRTSITTFASTVSAGVSICSASRSFNVFSTNSNTGSTYTQIVTGNASPWSVNSGTTYRNLTTSNSVGYGLSGAGKLQIRGAGSIGSWVASQAIRVYITINGQSRTLTYY
jgi:hypothetical protein